MKVKYVIAVVLTTMIMSCSYPNKMEGEVVKDKNGKYYQLTSDKVLGQERYRLIELDTNLFVRF